MQQPRTSAPRSFRLSDAVDAQEAFREYWDNAPDALFALTVRPDGQFEFSDVNPVTETRGGLNPAVVIGRRPEDVLDPTTAAMVTARYRQCVREERTITYTESLSLPAGAGDWRTTLTPVRDETGRIVRILGASREIVRDGAAWDVIVEAELQKVLDALPTGIALLDGQGVILFVNSVWRRFGERHEVRSSELGVPYLEACANPANPGLPAATNVALPLHRLLAGHGDGFSHRYTWGDRHFVLRARSVELGGTVRVALAHQDVTDLMAAQRMLAEHDEQLILAQEAERARIAMELHDSTSQHLVALGFSLAALRRTAAPGHVLDDMRRSLDEAHREIRALTYLLYPPKLSPEGLQATLRTFVEGFRRRTGLSLAISVSGQIDDLSAKVQRAVFRVVQEALANVHRHARAQRVAIDVVVNRKGLRLTIADDGQHQTDGAILPTGVGIQGMQARFDQLGGQVRVNHHPFGTVVDGHIPPERLSD